MAYRPATGRPIRVPRVIKTSRDLMRKHLKARDLTIGGALADWWDMAPTSAYRRMYDNRLPLSPGYIESFIAGCDKIGQPMEALEQYEMRFLAAREAGWDLDPKYLQLLFRARTP